MKTFLFITTLTPSGYLTPLRKELLAQFLLSLQNQTYTGWKALLVGEEEKTDGNFIYRKIRAASKEIKLMFAAEYLRTIPEKPDYIIRIDDDDLIAPSVLQRAAAMNEDFDCYADAWHTYYDVVSGKTCQVKNPWLPNTIIQKFEHAVAPYGLNNLPLMIMDHSIHWLGYYRKKKIVYADKRFPVYLRLMSPTAGTSGMHNRMLTEFSDTVLSEYQGKILGTGYWKFGEPVEFTPYIANLRRAWETVSGRKMIRGKNSFVSQMIHHMKSMIGR